MSATNTPHCGAAAGTHPGPLCSFPASSSVFTRPCASRLCPHGSRARSRRSGGAPPSPPPGA
jgi:hypothetical protein